MTKKSNYLLSLFRALLLASPIQAQNLLPKPQQVTMSKGVFKTSDGVKVENQVGAYAENIYTKAWNAKVNDAAKPHRQRSHRLPAEGIPQNGRIRLEKYKNAERVCSCEHTLSAFLYAIVYTRLPVNFWLHRSAFPVRVAGRPCGPYSVSCGYGYAGW